MATATPVLRLAALLLGLIARTDVPALVQFPCTVRVAVDGLETFAEPDDAAFGLERLKKGDALRVRDADPVSGWLTIEAPAGAFCWVAQAAVRPEGAGSARVSAGRAVVRAGMAGARMPGPPGDALARDTVVKLLDRPPITTGAGEGRVTWLAVAARADSVRYVRADGVAWPEPEPTVAVAAAQAETRARYNPGPELAPPGLPAEVAGQVARIEAEHRDAIRGSIPSWTLATVRAHYEALLARTTDPAAVEAIRARLALVASHEEISRAGRTIETILERSRRRDKQIATTHQRLSEQEGPQRRPYVAEGLVQPSSRQVEGRRVYALIGPEGAPVAYLDIPPGLDARPALAKRVGVRGSIRFDDELRARVIAVRDLETLE